MITGIVMDYRIILLSRLFKFERKISNVYTLKACLGSKENNRNKIDNNSIYNVYEFNNNICRVTCFFNVMILIVYFIKNKMRQG